MITNTIRTLMVCTLLAGCANPATNSKQERLQTKPDVLFTPDDTAAFERVAFETLNPHIGMRDVIVRGPATRIVLNGPEFLPESWHFAGGQGIPPKVDFKKNTMVLIATDTYGSGNMNVSVDSVFKVGTKLFVFVQEYSNGEMTDVSSRGTIVLLIPGIFDGSLATFISRPVLDRFDH